MNFLRSVPVDKDPLTNSVAVTPVSGNRLLADGRILLFDDFLPEPLDPAMRKWVDATSFCSYLPIRLGQNSRLYIGAPKGQRAYMASMASIGELQTHEMFAVQSEMLEGYLKADAHTIKWFFEQQGWLGKFLADGQPITGLWGKSRGAYCAHCNVIKLPAVALKLPKTQTR